MVGDNKPKISTPDTEHSEKAIRLEESNRYAVARLVPSVLILIFAILTPGRCFLAPPLSVLAMTLLFPGRTTALLSRVGFVRSASLLARLDGWNWGRDRRGGQSVTLARGLLSQPTDGPNYRSLEVSLEVAQLSAGRLTAGIVLAEGLRSLIRGDRADARRLWRLVVEFDRRVRPPMAAALATDLLAAEAADRGEFDRMMTEITRPRMVQTKLASLLRACLAKARGEITREVLEKRWLTSWTWISSRPLVERVQAIAPSPPPPPVPIVDDPLQAALVASARLGEAPFVRRSAVLHAAQAWEVALAQTKLPAQVALDELRTHVIDSLAERLDHTIDSGHTIDSRHTIDSEHTIDSGQSSEGTTSTLDSQLFREIVWRCADRRDDHLRWLSTELGNRADLRNPVPLLQEVRAWCQVLEAYEAVVAIAPERAIGSFPKLYYPGVRLAVWLHNERGQATVANAMYRVMLRHAEAAGHEAGIALLRNNLACGP